MAFLRLDANGSYVDYFEELAMRVLVKATRLGGRWVQACFESNARIDATDKGRVVVTIGSSPLRPGEELEAHLEILDATPAELDLLRRSGCHFNESPT